MKQNNLIVGFLKVALLGLMIAIVAPLSAANTTDPGVSQEQSAQPAQDNLVSINTGTLDQLKSLPRIGPKLGQRIIDFRDQHGGFKALEELMNVSGIGEKTFANLKPLIKL